MKTILAFCSAGALLLSQAAQADSTDAQLDPFRASLGAKYTSGKYEALQSSELGTITAGLEWSVLDTTTLSLLVPFVNQRAPRGSVGSGGGSLGGGTHRGNGRKTFSPEITTSGIGDVVLGFDQGLLKQSSSMPADLSVFADVKFGTAEVSKGLGSGQNDYSFGIGLGRTWSRFRVDAEGSYTFVGNPGTVTANGVQTTLDYRNSAFASLSGSYDVSKHTRAALTLSESQSYERGLSTDTTLEASLRYRPTHRFTLKGSILGGLTHNSPDFGVGAFASLSL